MPNQPREPAADLRQFAKVCREMFLALMEEGFTETQALQILGVFVAGSIGNASG